MLKVKIADWAGVLVINPASLDEAQRELLLDGFNPLAGRETLSVVEEVTDTDRIAFDELYLQLCGAKDPGALRIAIERELRAAMGERHERAHSLDEAKALKAKITKVTASVDAYATRVAALLEPHPDPRAYVDEGAPSNLILVASPWDGPLRIGEDLLTQGQVLAGDQPIAQAGDMQASQFLRSVLLHDPDLSSVPVPLGDELERVMQRWNNEIVDWRERFEEAIRKTTAGVADDRTKRQIRARALELLHAQ